MKNCFELNSSERSILLSSLSRQYGEYCKMGLSLDLSRGKPNASQLDVSMGLMSVDLSSDYRSENGFDCRNYGLLDGLAEMKVFFADVYGIDKNDIVIGGNSSLQLMYTVLSTAMIAGLHNSPRPWCYEENRKWICITPGYDRHFRITEKFGFELIGVPMINGQPDMDKIEAKEQVVPSMAQATALKEASREAETQSKNMLPTAPKPVVDDKKIESIIKPKKEPPLKVTFSSSELLPYFPKPETTPGDVKRVVFEALDLRKKYLDRQAKKQGITQTPKTPEK